MKLPIRPWVGLVLFVVAMLVAMFRPFEDETQISTQPATTTVPTTTPAPTSTIVVNGMSFPVPPLPPGVTLEPEPGQPIVNIHERVTSLDQLTPEQREALAKVLADMGLTTTTTTRP